MDVEIVPRDRALYGYRISTADCGLCYSRGAFFALPHLGAADTQPPTALQHLSTPPSLNRIPLLRQRIQRERAQLQQTLSSRAKDQVDLVKHGLAGLKAAKDASNQLKEHLRQVEHLMLDPRGHVQGFGKLVEVRGLPPFDLLARDRGTDLSRPDATPHTQVSVIHRRLTQTLEMVESLRSMYSRLAHLSQLLAADRADPLGPSPNLLTVHYHLTELETFRNETLAQAKRAGSGATATLLAGTVADTDTTTASEASQIGTSTTRETLERYFERLGETIEAFEAHYFRLARDLLVLARAGHAAVAVKLAKIAELEGVRDQKAIAIRMVKKAGNVDVASRFRSLQADARTIKHYRSKTLDAIRDACKTRVEKSYRDAGEDGVTWLDEIDWVYDDILSVRDLLTDKFPEDWHVRSLARSLEISCAHTLKVTDLLHWHPCADRTSLVSWVSSGESTSAS